MELGEFYTKEGRLAQVSKQGAIFGEVYGEEYYKFDKETKTLHTKLFLFSEEVDWKRISKGYFEEKMYAKFGEKVRFTSDKSKKKRRRIRRRK